MYIYIQDGLSETETIVCGNIVIESDLKGWDVY